MSDLTSERAAEPNARVSDIPRVQSVLASTDFSDVANQAIPHAYAAVDDGGTVHLVHVLEAPETPSPLYAHYRPGQVPSADERQKLHADLGARLRALAPAGAAGRGIRTEVHVVDDATVAAGIARIARQLGVDLICVGTHGRSGLFKTLLGSVTEAVLRETRSPVLVVPRRGR